MLPRIDFVAANKPGAAAEEVMKAVLALVLIYVGTFFVAIQGAPNNSVRAAQSAGGNSPQADQPKSIDPAKEADIRSLLELIDARDMIHDTADSSVQQFKDKITANLSSNERAQAAANAFAAAFRKNYNPDALVDQLVGIYDQHFTEQEIKGLLEFYGSPVGQKTAAEMPKISREIQAAVRAVTNKTAHDTWQELKAENPGAMQGARPFAGRRRGQQGRPQAQDNAAQQAQSDSQQP